VDKREDIIAIAKQYSDLIKSANFPIQIGKSYLFGSFAKGNPHEDSDIDIAFVVNDWAGGYEETVLPAWKLRRNIDFRIEPHFVVPDEDYANFLPEIQRTGIELV